MTDHPRPDDAAPAPGGRRTLVLTSRRVPYDLRAHTRGPNAVAVNNAADVYPRFGRSHKSAKDDAALRAAGFTVKQLDLRGHDRRSPGPLREALNDADLIWVGGGNTFWLLYQMHRSGFAGLVDDLLDSGVTYCGESAGAVACAPTMSGVDYEDDPRYSPDPTLPGLGLVDFLPWAHWNPNRPGHQGRHDPLPGVTTPMYRIRDGEYLLVTADQAELRRTTPPATQPETPGDLTLW